MRGNFFKRQGERKIMVQRTGVTPISKWHPVKVGQLVNFNWLSLLFNFNLKYNRVPSSYGKAVLIFEPIKFEILIIPSHSHEWVSMTDTVRLIV